MVEILRDPRDKVQVLYYGLMDRNQEITHLLIDKIPNNMLDMNDLLIQAIKNGDDYIVDYAINAGANKIDEALKEVVHVDNRQLIRKLATTYPRLDTVFNEAILVNNQELVEDIVSYGRLDIHVLNRGLENAVTG